MDEVITLASAALMFASVVGSVLWGVLT